MITFIFDAVGTSVFEFITQTLVATTILMISVLLCRDIVARHYGPRASYLLWLAPALRMIMRSAGARVLG